MPPVFKIEDSLEERSTAAFPPPLNIAPLPPMIVTEKGESLDEFCARRYPDPFTVVQARASLQSISPLACQLCYPMQSASAADASGALARGSVAALWPLDLMLVGPIRPLHKYDGPEMCLLCAAVGTRSQQAARFAFERLGAS